MTPETISILGLALCLAPGALHAIELGFPLLARWIVNFVLPFFSLTLPSPEVFLTHDEQITMLDGALEAGPAGKETAAADYVFVMIFEQRQGAIAFLSVIAAVMYALTIPLAARHPLHLLLTVMSVLFALVNANHAGVPLLGHHPKVSQNGRNVGIVFTPFWAAAAVLNGLAFTYALA